MVLVLVLSERIIFHILPLRHWTQLHENPPRIFPISNNNNNKNCCLNVDPLLLNWLSWCHLIVYKRFFTENLYCMKKNCHNVWLMKYGTLANVNVWTHKSMTSLTLLWRHHDMTTYPDNAIRGPCDNDIILVPLKQLQESIHNMSKWINQPHQTHTSL